MKLLGILLCLVLCGSCVDSNTDKKNDLIRKSIVFDNVETINKYANTMSIEALQDHVYTLTSQEFQGRKTGEAGHNKASNFLKDFYIENDIQTPFGNKNYFQKIPAFYFSDHSPASQNVVAFIEGSEYPDEIIILSAHLDHLGIVNDDLYPGADDNASGTSALMEIAKAFALSKKQGDGPKRSLLFLHLTAEEEGLHGSSYYIKHPIYPLKNSIVNLNIDMIGRVDRIYEKKREKNYIYIIGADRLSTKLHYISEVANSQFTKLILDYRYNAENDSNRYYYRSDHYNFARHNIPVIFYFNGDHVDYHQPTDTADKINFPLLKKRAQLIFSTAWYLANSEERLMADKI